MRVLVTGASGFVGKQAVAALIAAGAEVHAAARRPAPMSCVGYSVDLLEPGLARALVEEVRPDAVLHLAWCVEHGKFWSDPANLDWAGATLALARASADVGVARFIGAGTCYEYDWPETGVCREGETPLARHTLYDASKAACRALLEAFFESTPIGFVWARLFFLYGPGEDPRRLVASIARALAVGDPAYCSRGLATRDFMDVRDAGAALAATALAPIRGAVNIGSGTGVRVSEIATLLGRLARCRELVHLGALADRENEPPRIVANVDRLRREVGFRPAFDLETGLGDALDYWKRCEGHGSAR